ncbi:hypothetical protein ACQ4PO_03670 [Anaerostipes hadrus]|uniref:hypothetical protein n=1 Tax=Anaerostipes hadrus TaxID=649756 RepID=UPI003D7BA289
MDLMISVMISARKNINIFFINSINKTIFEILKVPGTLRNLSLKGVHPIIQHEIDHCNGIVI